MTGHDHDLMNEIRDRDHAEFEEVCRQEQAEADAEAAYLEEQMQTPGTLLHDATMLQFRSIRALIDTQQSLLNRLADAIHDERSIHKHGEMLHHPKAFSEISSHRDQLCTMDSSIISLQSEVAGLRIQLERLKTELAITRQHLHEMQQWQNATQVYIVDPQMQTDREAWEEKMREGMI